jgi:hypothetical protein
MSNTPDNRPPGASDPARQDEIMTTLHSIMAQLTTLSNRLDLQGTTIAKHALLLDGTNGSAVAGGRSPGPDGTGGRQDTTGGADPRHHQPSGCDHHDDLKNSFYRPKLNFPRYDGESDPLPWLNRCESYFRGTRTLAAEQVWLASLHMDGAAAEWYYALEREYGMVPWSRFTELVNLCFGPPLRSNPLGELKDLRRTGSVDEYQRQFLALLCRCDGLSSTHTMNLFTAGLGEPMTSDVEMQRPADLQVAMSLARAFERRATIVTQAPMSRFPPRLRQQTAGPIASAAASTAPGSANRAPSASGSVPSPAPSVRSRFRRLTPDEMADKRRKGECYFCPENFSLDHKCAMKGVFLMELDDNDDPDLIG